MRNGMSVLCAGILMMGGMVASPVQAQQKATTQPSLPLVDVKPFVPLNLALEGGPESVYAPPTPPPENSGVNEGAVHFDLFVGYFTDYVYRGIELFEPPGAEDRANMQIDSKLSWDLGKFPHPFVAVFVNYADSDPVSSFQEVRPTVGLEWNIRPLILSGGNTTYIYPDRNEFETSEAWGKIKIDDSYFLHREAPLLSPYVLVAYDYDLYNGWYVEAGVSHDFVVEDTGLTITAQASAAYVHGMQLYTPNYGTPQYVPNKDRDDGVQHYQLGLIADYSLNKLLNFTDRYGDWSVQGFVYYTDGIDDNLSSTTQIWGGAGIKFKY
jgi:hypothetical protein